MRKKTLSVLAIAFIAMTMSPTTASAQFGKIFKKVVETVTTPAPSSSPSATTPSASAAGATVSLPNGAKIINPHPELFNIELVGCYGNSTDNTVRLMIKVTVKDLNYGTASNFGGGSITAYDADGTSYNAQSYDCKALMADVPAKFRFCTLKQVPKRITTLTAVTGGWSLDGSTKNDGSKVVFKNIPIQWDIKE